MTSNIISYCQMVEYVYTKENSWNYLYSSLFSMHWTCADNVVPVPIYVAICILEHPDSATFNIKHMFLPALP